MAGHDSDTSGGEQPALAADVPSRSCTLGSAILSGRKYARTLFSDDRPSGTAAQKSKQHQDHVSDSHDVPLLCCGHLLKACNHAVLSGAKKNAPAR